MASKLRMTVEVNEAWLQRDIKNLMATGMKIEEAVRSLPLGKYLRVEATPAGAGDASASDDVAAIAGANEHTAGR